MYCAADSTDEAESSSSSRGGSCDHAVWIMLNQRQNLQRSGCLLPSIASELSQVLSNAMQANTGPAFCSWQRV